VPPAPPSPSERALKAYKSSLRRPWAIYTAVVSVIVVVLGTVVLIYWANGESAHTTLHTAKIAAPPIGLQPISEQPTVRWRNNDHTAIGNPVWNGTVITYSLHRVNGRSLASGSVAWSYTRTDREVCQVIQDNGVAIAVFRTGNDCDQIDAFDAQTGERKWTRTLFKDGDHVVGEPTYSVGQFAVLIVSPDVIFAIDPSGGLDRWVFAQTGCTIRDAVIGTGGALISQVCTKPDCTGLKFCGVGEQLLLRDGSASRQDDKGKAKGNPDQIIWNNVGNDTTPVAADQLLASVNLSAKTLISWTSKGKVAGTAALSDAPITLSEITARATSAAEVIWIGGTTYAIGSKSGAVLWSIPTPGPPSVTSSTGATDPAIDLPGSIVLAPAAGGVVSLDPNSGAVRTTYPVSSPREGSSVYPFGSGFLIAGSNTIAYR